MTSEQKPVEQRRPLLSPFDLKQVKDAVGELRATHPRSVLVDLVEQKLREIEGRHAGLRFDLTPTPAASCNDSAGL